MTNVLQIITHGVYAKPMPPDLRASLEQSITAHMKAYGLEDIRVVTIDEDHKRAAAGELHEALELYLNTYSETDHHPTAVEEARCMNAARAALAKAR